jgi:hypothetical protein
MRESAARIVASISAACLLFGAGTAFAGLQGPPYGWAFTFDQAKIIAPDTPVTSENGLSNAPVRDALGSTLAHFLRIEIQDGVMPMAIITQTDPGRTIAVPLNRFRFNPARGEVLTDMGWWDAMLIPS